MANILTILLVWTTANFAIPNNFWRKSSYQINRPVREVLNYTPDHEQSIRIRKVTPTAEIDRSVKMLGTADADVAAANVAIDVDIGFIRCVAHDSSPERR